MPTLLLAVILGSAAGSFLLTALVRRHALRRALLDHPNERSLHSAPTPRGGGLAIATLTLAGIVGATLLGALPARAGVGMAGAGLLVALVGWADDVRPRPAALRAGVHALAAIWFLTWIGGIEAIDLGGRQLPLGWLGNLFALGAIVWSINLYNFMDGIDGLAGGQGVIAGVTGVILLAGGTSGLVIPSALVAGASLGFLWWNWAPARIFMGDVGSGLLGFLFAAIALLADREGGPGLLIWLMTGGVFLGDATLTLLRRMLRGERWYAAHKSHAYQRAVQSGWSHQRVSAAALFLCLVGAGLGWVALRYPAWQWWAVATEGALLLGVYLLVETRAPMRPA